MNSKISSQILLAVYLVKFETTLPRKVDPQERISPAFPQVTASLFDCGAKIRNHVQNNHSNLLPRPSFYNLASSNLPICFKVKSDVPQQSLMSPEVLKLRAFLQTSAIFLTAPKRVIQSIPATLTWSILLRWIARGTISSQIPLTVYLVKFESTLPRKVDPQQRIAGAFSRHRVTFWLRC
jgi:hypothetical protein